MNNWDSKTYNLLNSYSKNKQNQRAKLYNKMSKWSNSVIRIINKSFVGSSHMLGKRK